MDQKSLSGFLPVQPHLLAYLMWKENLQKGDQFIIPGQSPHAVVLSGYITVATRLIRDSRTVPPSGLKMHRYTARLPFIIPGLESTDFYIIADVIACQFDAYLYHAMQSDLLERVMFAKRFGIEEKDSIEAWLAESGLNYYLDFEAVKKAQYRLRAARQMPTVRGLHIQRTYSRFV